MKYQYSVISLLTLIFATIACEQPEPAPNPSVTIGVPQNVTLTANTGTSLTFGWSKVEDAVGYAARLENSKGEFVAQKNPALPSAKFEKLIKGESYVFKVKAKAEDGSMSEYSEALEVVTGESGTGEVPPEPEPEPDPEPNPDPNPDPDLPAGIYESMKMPAHEEHLGALAFPGAEGGGMYTTGGRGGRIIHVTNLNDSGAGSLRAAVNESGARIIVFDVAGIIDLKSTLSINNGDLTIAGQTAPGDGICLKNYSTQINASNVIMRFVRFRMGDEKKYEGDAVWGRYAENIIIDHCSMSWSTDECSSFYANKNFTMQWCILSESLRNSVHSKEEHGYGGIWGGKNASFHHNMLANHDSRNPRFDHPQIYDKYLESHRGNVDYRNNVVFNWGSNSSYGGEEGCFNMVNNYYKEGEASRDRKYFLDVYADYKKEGVVYADSYPKLYLSGNVHTNYSDISSDNSLGLYWHHGATYANYKQLLSSPLEIKGQGGQTVYITTQSAEEAFGLVCELGGASLRLDSVDERACRDAKSGKASFTDGGNGSKGGIIDTQAAVGGWPVYSATTAESDRLKDSDGDGMPDWFEDEFGLDKADASDGNTKNIDVKKRYTNVEMYLHYLVRDIVEKQTEIGNYTALN